MRKEKRKVQEKTSGEIMVAAGFKPGYKM